MGRRSEELRRTHRRTFGWSLGVAVLLHAGLFWFSPEFRTVLPDRSSVPPKVVGGEEGEVRWVDVTFGPPRILLGDGVERQEPPERVLEARAVNIAGIPLEPECHWARRADLEGSRATVKLKVGWEGRVTEAGLAEGSGDACVDDVLVAVAGTLWYRWLPDAQAPAPVDVLQPMEVRASR
ncbi:MAG: hypothetical protein WD960_11905 [Gemmatimonadota bacterium]